MPDVNDILYAPLGTMTYKRGDDGFLYVTGKMSDDTLDLDSQIVDPDWLDAEAPDWFKIGNTRVMHQPVVGGKATKLVKNGTGWDATIKVTNPQAAIDVEEGALTGLSIGIKGARVIEDSAAPNGRIVGGKIVELSLVDRPANPSCHLTLTKMAGDTLELTEDVEIVGEPEEEPTTDDSPAKSLSADIVKGFAELTKSATHDPAELKAIRSGFVSLITAELAELDSGSDDEISDLYQLLSSLSTFLCWWDDEADEGETDEPFPDESGDSDMDMISLGVNPDTIKAARADDATEEQKAAPLAELRKSLGLDDIATKAEIAAQQEVIKGLEAELKSIREMAAPGQPALRATLDQQNKSAEADELENTAARYIANAYAQTDKAAAAQYVEAAEALTKRAKELRQTL